MHVVSERPDSEVALHEDDASVSSVNVQSFVDAQQWTLHSHVQVSDVTSRSVTSRPGQ